MSLIGTLCSRQGLRLGKGLSLQQLRVTPTKWLATTSCVKAAQPLDPEEGFWDKNKRLNRPMSPHLTIYKLQITSVLSVTHRGTGLALSGLMSGFAIGMLALPQSFPHYYTMLSSSPTGTAVLFTAKLILAWPFIYHFANGIRHLAWDLGKGFGLKELYTSGYAVLAVSTILSLAAAAM
ncbi:hypothetical protein Ocin01_03744 [Orchesella cincta]|uniref:Uncharacterized protein n=1 Tax=Orchesella cincta TaxID=48709 RepID=A0A1D2ND61_ORCCI|nr:hypothetical protein Ocin01_03744 [Orchesella cincta]